MNHLFCTPPSALVSIQYNGPQTHVHISWPLFWSTCFKLPYIVLFLPSALLTHLSVILQTQCPVPSATLQFEFWLPSSWRSGLSSWLSLQLAQVSLVKFHLSTKLQGQLLCWACLGPLTRPTQWLGMLKPAGGWLFWASSNLLEERENKVTRKRLVLWSVQTLTTFFSKLLVFFLFWRSPKLGNGVSIRIRRDQIMGFLNKIR